MEVLDSSTVETIVVITIAFNIITTSAIIATIPNCCTEQSVTLEGTALIAADLRV